MMGTVCVIVHHDGACSAELDEDWYHSQDPVDSGVNFFVKVSLPLSCLLRQPSAVSLPQYLGSTEVTQTHGPGSTDDAVKTIVHHVSGVEGRVKCWRNIVWYSIWQGIQFS